MLDYAWIIPALPAVSFFVIMFFGKRAPKHGAEIGIAAVGASFLLSCVAVVEWINRVEDATGGESHGLVALGKSIFAAGGAEHGVAPVVHTLTWWTSGGTEFGVGTTVDGLTVMMMFVVTLISLLVQIYSTAYMHDDRRYTWFFACLSLFTASMLTLVVSENLLQLLVGWELVGLCSFMLIGHWWEDRANSRAAIKAFLTTRVGDIGLMIGVIIMFFAAGTFSIVGINEYALGGEAQHSLLMFGALCLFIGIIGKSGQFPLHTWLPDAMAGPTPVSALIHAATMVVAGVYLGARVYPVLYEGFNIHDGGANFMAIIGGVTILIGALLAFVQRDIKRVLAYSTISQLGYMVMALGVGAWTAAVFHLFTHAFFKALLFLGAGSVSHSGSHHSFDMKSDMGGLRKHMPVTFATFMIGSLALAGIFPLAGFWSKDEILATAGESGFDAFVVVGLIGAVLTAAYMTRCVYLTFFGEYRGHGHPHESPRAITVPLIILSVFSVLAGFANAVPLGIHKFTEWFEPTFAFPHLVHAEFDYSLAIISVAIALVGIGIAASLWFRKEELGPFAGLTKRNALAGRGYTFLENKYYLDFLYENVIVDGIRGGVARAYYWFDQNVIDAVVKGVGRGAARAGRFAYDALDQRVVDGSINAIAAGTGEAGGAVRTVQSGRVQRYALLLFASVGVMALAVFLANVD
ncbi:MAG: NADH-quinone oxidoreductase subunit L [Actinobacteria bacterium]|nr:NADH-quinone oxidoreductase subunit L [Actinomycetota bacterium]